MKDVTFSSARMLELYDRTSDAEDAIPDLRRFVLDLAVRGKLVEQDTAEEPASELMRRSKTLKDEEGVKTKADPIQGDDIPFPAPPGWSWTRLGTIAVQTGSGSTPRGGKSAYSDDGTPFLRSQNVYDDGLRLDDVVYINDETNEKMKRTKVKPKDLLLNITGGSIGRCTRIPDEFSGANVSQHVAIVRTAAPGTEDYLHLLVRSPFFQDYVLGEQTGAGRGGLPKNRMDRIPVPLPPLAEQNRIVAKVDELMALCDQLEHARAAREAVRDRLTTASLARLTTPDTDAETFQSHTRFALQSLSTLTTRPDQIKTLRQTILNLAVRGKLVAQDAGDEPAAELLKRIAADKAERAVSARDKRATKIVPLAVDDASFQIPSNWVWAAFGDVTISRDGERKPVSREEREQRAKVYDYYGASGIIDKIDGFLFDKPLLLIGEDGANLINRSTPIAFIARGQYWVNNHAHVLDGLSEQLLRYVELFINATDLKPYVTGTAQPKMNQTKMNSIPVALPPLSEQHRIVAKVDALMALCDQLEASLTATDTTRSKLLNALLHEALEPAAKTADV